MNKIVVTKKEVKLIPFTQQEIEQRELDQQQQEQQAILDSLTPSQSEIDKAERELETITLLQYLEVI